MVSLFCFGVKVDSVTTWQDNESYFVENSVRIYGVTYKSKLSIRYSKSVGKHIVGEDMYIVYTIIHVI